MPEQVSNTGPLAGIRVLDMSRILAGPTLSQNLGDLGADVIKIERPGLGDDTRRWGPPDLASVNEGKEGWSGYYLCANRNKRSVAINIATPEGQDLIRRLAAKADILIENYKQGGLAKYGLDYATLSKLNSGLIYCSITGFGQTGPYKDFKAPDIVCMAVGGEMNLIGYPDRPPLRIGFPQAYLHAGVETAAACLAALWHKETTGNGQYIDTSAQECVAWLGFYNQNMWDLQKTNIKREGSRRKLALDSEFRFLYATQDGYVSFLPSGL